MRPSRFLFLCGGARVTDPAKKAANLRDYLLRTRPIKTAYPIVLAEEATQLYRDTTYGDLITFEEDIARIAAIVLVIAESAGALAELGAFATNDTIRSALRVVLPSHHEIAESFVRYGPVERLKNESRDKLGIYPWRTHANGTLNVSSVKPHYREMVTFINGHVDSIPKSTSYQNLGPVALFYVIYWVIHQSMAISPKILIETVQLIVPTASVSDIRNKIYCMQLAKWIQRLPYSGKDYFFALHDEEPFDYVYKADIKETSTVRRKLAIRECLRKVETIPHYVAKRAAAARIPKP